jgi:hypothetical protein
MTPAEIIDALNRAGASIVIEEGKPRLRGPKLPEDLVSCVRENREAILAEIERRRREDLDRYGRVPPVDAPMLDVTKNVSTAERVMLQAYVIRQPRPCHAWVMKRASEYHQRGLVAEDCDWRAALDLVAWQRQTSVERVFEFLGGIEACVKDLQR